MPSRFILTVTPDLEKSALVELRAVTPDLSIVRELKNGAFLAETSMTVDEFTARIVKTDPIFVKHMHPVQAVVSLSGERATDFPVVLDTARQVAHLVPGEPFTVQCRHVGLGHDYDSKDVEVAVGSFFESQGAIPTFSDDRVQAAPSEKVISIFVFVDRGYAGFSTVRENLNEHPDEYRIFSRRPRRVSRAEFKLQEALRKFDLHPEGGRALDLGAAPGGWTQVLADAGMQVTAVDPAALNSEVLAHPNVRHVQVKADAFEPDGLFDLLVDDMNVEPEESAAMMVKMAGCLRRGAYAILTCKFVIHNARKLLDNIRPILEREYEILHIKNLYHNRMEVTVLLRRK